MLLTTHVIPTHSASLIPHLVLVCYAFLKLKALFLSKRPYKLRETLIVPNINVNLFSLQRVLRGGFIPVYGEVEGKCLIKKRSESGNLIQVASMIVVNGRATLDCRLVAHTDKSSEAAPQTHC